MRRETIARAGRAYAVGAVLIAAILGLLPTPWTAARDADPPGAGEGRSGAPPSPADAPAGDEPDIHPDAVSSYVSRTYRIAPRELWDELLIFLKENGYPPEEVDEKERVVKTSFVDFEAGDFSEEVGDPAPRISADYQILQLRRVKVGKLSLEARVVEGERGTDLVMRARILVQGLDQKNRVLLLTDRRSSGVIEADLLRRLEDKLHLERL